MWWGIEVRGNLLIFLCSHPLSSLKKKMPGRCFIFIHAFKISSSSSSANNYLIAHSSAMRWKIIFNLSRVILVESFLFFDKKRMCSSSWCLKGKAFYAHPLKFILLCVWQQQGAMVSNGQRIISNYSARFFHEARNCQKLFIVSICLCFFPSCCCRFIVCWLNFQTSFDLNFDKEAHKNFARVLVKFMALNIIWARWWSK